MVERSRSASRARASGDRPTSVRRRGRCAGPLEAARGLADARDDARLSPASAQARLTGPEPGRASGPWALSRASSRAYRARYELDGPGMNRTALIRVVSALAVVSALTACAGGSPGSDSVATPDRSRSQPPTALPVTAADARAKELLIDAADLPSGWRDSSPPGAGFRMTVCGVDLEPAEPVGRAKARWAVSPVGPFLYEYVRVHSDAEVPARVVSELTAALPTCREFTTRGESPTSPEATFSLDALKVEALPRDSVAWRMVPKTGSPVIQDVVLVARAETLVALLSASLNGPPDPAVLAAALSALERR